MNLGRIAGIPIRLHWSFFILMAVYAGSSLFTGGVSELLSTLLVLGALFATVVLHELGHALAGRHYGIPTRSITLWPFGGIAAMEGMPTKPRQELVVALAGPAVNAVLAVLIGSLWLLLGGGMGVLAILTAINVIMGVFNLTPAFPMDGGRVLRALLARRMGYFRGTRAAILVGRVLAWGFVILGLVEAWWSLLLVGGFVLFALRREKRVLDWQELQAARYSRVPLLLRRAWTSSSGSSGRTSWG